MILHDVEQGSDEWLRLRLARPTASRFSDILTRPRNKADRISRTTFAYLCECFAEWVLLEPLDAGSSPWMERGQRQEPEALAQYQAFFAPDGAEVKAVGFVTLDDDLLSPGCSPDALVGDTGGLELKILKANRHPAFMFEPERFLKEHEAQVQGGLWITGREWWHLVAYNPVLPPVIHRVERDEVYIQNLAERVEEFTGMLRERLIEFGYQPQTTVTANDIAVRPDPDESKAPASPAAPQKAVATAPASPATSDQPIGPDSLLYKKVQTAYDKLGPGARTEIRTAHGFKWIADIGTWNDVDASKALKAIEDIAGLPEAKTT